MTEEQIRAAVRAEITPVRREVNGRFKTLSETLDEVLDSLEREGKALEEAIRDLPAIAEADPCSP